MHVRLANRYLLDSQVREGMVKWPETLQMCNLYITFCLYSVYKVYHNALLSAFSIQGASVIRESQEGCEVIGEGKEKRV
jgi:hypothetical protein